MSENLNPFRVMDSQRVWELLDEMPYGRLAVQGAGLVDIFPVNHVVNQRKIYFRTSQGTKLASLVVNNHVAFEVDKVEGTHVESAVVHGRARRLETRAEVEAAEQLPLTPWAPNYKFHYVVLEPDDATGREFTMGEQPDHDL
ncbi:pyridoxamine 5-phosphate oxidase [Kocuria marina]|uniref:Pyridoxamine 5-phosphate oxidase n=1 Tax=Kocuria marina TaxID=223184 RepID=A0A0B0D8H0_9MICC|nr:pyridoxamine 5'-phosphate oxidase family protein [Kocuria marina]KHE73713.1 pyridoxamine 5-phosphate oxidase [Kocuria marina]